MYKVQGESKVGKKSIKENKNPYQITREKLELTREEASERLVYLTSDRIERIENEKTRPTPDDVIAMADGYKAPVLCSYYCAKQCPIGERYSYEIEEKPLSQIVLEMLDSFNKLRQKQDNLVAITVDGKIEDGEIEDFVLIEKELHKVSVAVKELELWSEQMQLDGKINVEKYNRIKNKK